MEPSRNGGGKVVTFEEPMVIGRHRNGSLSSYHDIIGRDVVARPLQPQGTASRRRTYADGELDVFSAERYFKGAMDGGDHRKKDDGAIAAVAPPPLEMMAAAASAARPAVAVAKPAGSRASAASSATSTNSRTMLLRRQRRDHGRDNTKLCCVHVGALVRSCSGKRSVRVDDTGAAKEGAPGPGEPPAASSKIDWYKELRMQKAALGVALPAGDGGANHGVVAAAATAATLPPNLNTLGAAKVAAIGREVVTREENKGGEFESRRGSCTLVVPVRANGHAGGDAGGGGEDDDDDYDGAGSESSSDLFEIKSLMIDECPYEPSEASIQWSVATADASSERGDRVSARWVAGVGGHRGRGGGRGPVAGRQNRDRPPAGLLAGCVSHRAVEVSALPHAPRRPSEGFQKARSGGAG